MFTRAKVLKILLMVFFVAIMTAGLSACKKKNPAADNTAKKQPNELVKQNQKAIDQAGQTAKIDVRGIGQDDHVKGNIGAPVELIVYDDFECSFCARFADTLAQVAAEFPDKTAIAVRHFPLRSHSNAVPAAMVAECAAEQGKFWEMHDKLFEANKAGTLSSGQYKTDATEIGLDINKFDSCVSEEKYLDKIQAHVDEGRSYGVSGTPGSFVNGEPIPGAVPFEDYQDSEGGTQEGMRSIIERHLK